MLMCAIAKLELITAGEYLISKYQQAEAFEYDPITFLYEEISQMCQFSSLLLRYAIQLSINT